MGMTFPVFQSIGNDPVVSDWVKMHSNMMDEYSLVFLRNLKFISSTPQEEDNFNFTFEKISAQKNEDQE